MIETQGHVRLFATGAFALLGAVVCWLGNLDGLWWVTLIVGIALGVVACGFLSIAFSALLAGLLGWGVHLAWLAPRAPIGRLATVVAEVMGFGSSGSLIIALALIFAALLALSGAWLGAAVRRAVFPSARVRPPARRAIASAPAMQ